jgi:hypothetical protein
MCHRLLRPVHIPIFREPLLTVVKLTMSSDNVEVARSAEFGGTAVESEARLKGKHSTDD